VGAACRMASAHVAGSVERGMNTVEVAAAG
jgi:hypothetical protein